MNLFTAYMGWIIFRVHHPMSDELGMCGEIVAQPTRSILNIGVPLAASATAGLIILSRVGLGAKRPVFIAAGVATICILGLIGFALWLANTEMPGMKMGIWWMFN